MAYGYNTVHQPRHRYRDKKLKHTVQRQLGKVGHDINLGIPESKPL